MSRQIHLLVLCGLLLTSVISMAQGYSGSEDIPGFIIFSAKPGYQMTAQDYLDEGNLWKVQCAAVMGRMAGDLAVCDTVDENVAKAACNAEVSIKYPRPVDYSRLFLGTDKTGYGSVTSSRGKLVMDVTPAATDARENAKRAYSKAFQLTADDDNGIKAEILDAGAGIYHILGMTDEAEQVGEAAAAARDRKQASGLFAALLPLSGWVAMLGVIGGILVMSRWS